MIRFIVTAEHGYTFNALTNGKYAGARLPVEIWSYPRVFSAKALPPGTWIFCDLERLSVWELRMAGEIARLLRESGESFHVHNDPARAACRYELLHRLHQAGFNSFRAFRAEDGMPHARFPVFLRLESDHDFPLTGLIETSDALHRALMNLESQGVSRRGLLIIEYETEPLAPGVFRKYAAYRFGSQIVADHMVHDVTWLAKYGAVEAWSPERYAQEAKYVRDNPHEKDLMRAFEIGAIEYGRADYGIVGGAPQIWEINTNPSLPEGDPEKCPPDRVVATLLSKKNRLSAIVALDSSNSGPWVRLQSGVLDRNRNWQRWRRKFVVRRN
jgi:hypothetical protein